MMVLSDIWLINYFKPLKGLFKDKEFQISNLFLGGYSLNYSEKLFIKNLNDKGKISLFETDLGFYKIKEENKDLISNSEASSIYYAELNNYPVVTQHDIISTICKNKNIKVYQPLQALKILNIGNDKIEFIQRLLNSSMKKT